MGLTAVSEGCQISSSSDAESRSVTMGPVSTRRSSSMADAPAAAAVAAASASAARPLAPAAAADRSSPRVTGRAPAAEGPMLLADGPSAAPRRAVAGALCAPCAPWCAAARAIMASLAVALIMRPPSDSGVPEPWSITMPSSLGAGETGVSSSTAAAACTGTRGRRQHTWLAKQWQTRRKVYDT